MAITNQAHKDLAELIVAKGKNLDFLQMELVNINAHPDSHGRIIREHPSEGAHIHFESGKRTNDGRDLDLTFNPFGLRCELTTPSVIEQFLEDLPYWTAKRGYDITSTQMSNEKGRPMLLVYDRVVFNPCLMTDFWDVRDYCKKHDIDVQELH